MVKDDDQKSANGSIAEVSVEESTANVAEDLDKVVKQLPSSSNASQSGEVQPEVQQEPEPEVQPEAQREVQAEVQQDEEVEETQEEENQKSAEDLHSLVEELDKITVSAPSLYAVLVCILSY